jgi:GT2 family glycosyltransferase
VVVVSHNEGDRLRRTVHGLMATLPRDGDIVVVDDASTDGSADFLGPSYGSVQLVRSAERLGAPRARNRGAAVCRGDVIVFADAHVDVGFGWVSPFQAALDLPGAGAVGPAVSVMGNPAAKGYGLTWQDAALNVHWLGRQGEQPYAVPLLPGCFMAMRRNVLDICGGFDEGLPIWGSEDAELSLRLWLLGYECLIVPQVEVAHFFRERFPYELDWATLQHNLLRLGIVHFGPARLKRLVACLASNPAFPVAFAQLVEGDTWARREQFRAVRQHDDDWFFDRFDISHD